MCKRERERQRQTDRQTDRDRDREEVRKIHTCMRKEETAREWSITHSEAVEND